jgi:hypothetical protein
VANLLTVDEDGGVVRWLTKQADREAKGLAEMVEQVDSQQAGRALRQEVRAAERVSQQALREALESR